MVWIELSCMNQEGGSQINPEMSRFIYLVSERKLGFFVKVKKDQNFNRRNTLSILRIKIFI